ncbi:4-hydroxybenzoate octaprenyltransferase [Posidoniimonas polymericola]|uniref:4-hydroxybenzoate polyprenyltransferase n=1 Tax=Posidoniimonas polymericola TaxID=2528002 RepID=A0A5C5ZGC2_9BACT|nr:4-hydroxybenzoate octaprenyltransferase [Posidoniimonas polymericola]TWT85613.1 4-hydroxybenzoate octaprenyltransferase [Posidoniimonas polymericola]
MLQTAKHLLSLIRFSHTIFALPFALLAALMAWHYQAFRHVAYLGPGPKLVYLNPPGSDPVVEFAPSNLAAMLDVRWQELLGILLCMVFARSAAMAFNRLVDRQIDAGNPRTAGRHLPAGILSVTQVTAFAVLCSAGFVASTLLFLPNWLPFYLSVPVLLFLCGYSYTKRFTSLAHFWLGAALAMSPLAAWIAIRGEAVMQNPLDLLPAATLGAGVLTWVAGFDILYACQDYDFDRGAELNSIPTRLGVPGALRLAAGCHAATVLLLALLPLVYPPFGWLYGIGIAAVAVLLVYEHRLVSPDNLEKVNLAFFNVNAVISLGLLVVGALDLMV